MSLLSWNLLRLFSCKKLKPHEVLSSLSSRLAFHPRQKPAEENSAVMSNFCEVSKPPLLQEVKNVSVPLVTIYTRPRIYKRDFRKIEVRLPL
jgi:hypothetical protein